MRPRPSNRQNMEKRKKPQEKGKKMKKKFVACLLAGLMLLGAAALADGGEWHESRIGGSVRLTGYTGDYNGYVSADGLGGVAGADDGYVTVISKSATLWSKPSTGSKKVASMNHQDVRCACTTEATSR